MWFSSFRWRCAAGKPEFWLNWKKESRLSSWHCGAENDYFRSWLTLWADLVVFWANCHRKGVTSESTDWWLISPFSKVIVKKKTKSFLNVSEGSSKKRESSSRLFDQWVRNKNFHLSDFLSVCVCVPEFCLSINHCYFFPKTMLSISKIRTIFCVVNSEELFGLDDDRNNSCLLPFTSQSLTS